ncbi:NYN domain-containing protein [Candidatus Berkelbacteria bacterium]|nr:NYN domain-containing protein [Candidatus Berkelbacteria bacterium]MBI2588411.1 NYN domain-containing protein [Candidatus Berkelbacteria bacterium]MBI4029833.1 NYN domain-containing protein [Candidatus Berkelbacteria bacterium]
MKYTWQRVGVFVDVQNLYYSAKNLYNSYVNFAQILKQALGPRQLIRANAYVVRAEDPDQEKFFEALRFAGFDVRSKDLQIFPGGIKKGDWDVGLAVDMIKNASKLDVIVLVSGDGDFKELIEYLKGQGVRVEVMAFGKSASAKIKEATDEFIDLDLESSKFLLKQVRRSKSHLALKS